MRAQDQKVANQGLIYMAPFWRENHSVQSSNRKKKELERRAHDLKNKEAS
jgi:CDP-glycerol glycerophosphotransferase (TagB/SpsB family)